MMIWVIEEYNNDRQCYNVQLYWMSSSPTIVKNHQQQDPRQHWICVILFPETSPRTWNQRYLWFSDVGLRLIIDCAACQGINDSAMSHLAKVAQDCRDNGTTAEAFEFGVRISGREGEPLTNWGYYPQWYIKAVVRLLWSNLDVSVPRDSNSDSKRLMFQHVSAHF